MLMLISVLMFTLKLNSRIKFDFAVPTPGVSLAMFFDFIQLQSDQGKGEVQLKDRISVKGREGGQSWYGGLFTSYHATTMSHLLSRISHKYEIENAKLTNDIMLMHLVFYREGAKVFGVVTDQHEKGLLDILGRPPKWSDCEPHCEN